MSSIKTKVLKNLNKGFITEWEKMWEKSPHGHFFNSPKWFLICKKTFKIKDFRIFGTYHHGELKAVLPLVKTKKFGIPVFASSGGRYLEKSTLLMAEKNTIILASLFSEIEKYGSIFLSEVDAHLAQHIEKARPKSLISTISINPYIDLSDDPCRYLAKKQKSRIINKMKRFKSRLKHGHYSRNLSKHLKTVFEVEEKSAKRKKGREIFSNPQVQSLYLNLIKIAPENVIIDVLYYQDTPVVTMLGLIYKGKYLAYHTSYVDKFKKLLPGKILLYKMLTKLRGVNFRMIDFSRGHNEFKKEFTPFYTLQYDVYYSKNPLVRVWWEGINSLRRLKQVLIRNNRSLDDDYLFKIFKPHHVREPKKQLIIKLI